jgi:ABC-type transport system involved in cytochrome c biogenesis permease subunit
MPHSPTAGQLSLLVASIAAFAIGGAISLSRLWVERPWSRLSAKACMYFGITFALAVLVWHSVTRANWIPLDDNFDAFIWLGVMLAGFVAYVQRRKPIGGIDWFIMPIVILLLVAAAVFGSARPHAYLHTAWSWLHRVTSYGGAVAFAVGGAAGAMYLLANRKLRASTVGGGAARFGSLERLEHVTRVSVTLGFAMLTLGAITGFVQIVYAGKATPITKIYLTAAVWIVYGLVLHAPINPSFRGRKTALLSIVGLLLMISVLIAVQWLPSN